MASIQSDPISTAYGQLVQHTREIAVLESIESLLGWDERTLMPAASAPYRAEQMSLLAGMAHQRQTDPRVGEWLALLSENCLTADAHGDTGTTIRELKRKYERRVRLPKRLVEELTRASVLGQQAWAAARTNNDFASFRPHLEQMFRLKREQADAQGYRDCRYDALLEDYEPREVTANIVRVLSGLRDQLVPLVARICESGVQADRSILKRRYPIESQERFGRDVLRKIGFDFQRGRLDVTAHPFCSSPGPHDCRITTRYDEYYFPSAFFGMLHEAGHGIYDQGLRPELFGLPPGEAISLGVHESQSRLWENLVGRSRAFWQHCYGPLRAAFPEAIGNAPLEAFYAAINDVRPSPIRVEADEATYNLHILARFELEQALLDDDLQVADLPAAWTEKSRHYLGIAPANDSEGVLQDIHWGAGLVGYFPTYSLGNLYAAQFFEQADRDLGGLAQQFALGEFEPLRRWLQEHIHEHGQRYAAAELVQRVTGRPLSHEALMRHLCQKLEPLYRLR